MEVKLRENPGKAYHKHAAAAVTCLLAQAHGTVVTCLLAQAHGTVVTCSLA